MKLGLSKMFDEWFDEHHRLALANKWRRRSNHRLRSRYSHRPEEKHSEFTDEPLENPIVKAELDKGHEKYNRLNFREISKGGIPNSKTVRRCF